MSALSMKSNLFNLFPIFSVASKRLSEIDLSWVSYKTEAEAFNSGLQNYYGILMYLLIAVAICALLATLAYVFSLSATQDSEKRGEYECGFEPFDSATRLPFDVHFYLVGILFLIFDVEVALLLPWTMSLNFCGWFGFYLVIGFVLILGVGFLYEWKRGALVWPAHQNETQYSTTAQQSLLPLLLVAATQDSAKGAKLFKKKYLENELAAGRTPYEPKPLAETAPYDLGGSGGCGVMTTKEEYAECDARNQVNIEDFGEVYDLDDSLWVLNQMLTKGQASLDRPEIFLNRLWYVLEGDVLLFCDLVLGVIPKFRVPAPVDGDLIGFFTYPQGLLIEYYLTLFIVWLLFATAVLLHKGVSKRAIAIANLRVSQDFMLSLVLLYFYQLYIYLPTTSTLHLGGYFAVSALSIILKILVAISASLILAHSEHYVREQKIPHLEFSIMFLLGVLLMFLLVASNHLFSAFLSLVGFSLNLYVLIMFNANNASAREAAIKYYYLSAFSSGLIVYGIFLLYTATGEGQFDQMFFSLNWNSVRTTERLDQIEFALLFLLSGLFFKLSAFPAHLWAPEVYDGSPSPITTLFMVPVKIAVLAFALNLLIVALDAVADAWQWFFTVAAVGSMIWGAVGAFHEKRTKRFFAYASINQMGFILLGLATGSDEGYRATLIYMVLYVIMNIPLIIIFLQARRIDGRHLLFLSDFRGLTSGLEWRYTWSLAISLLSMAGIPPLAGFFGKYYLLFHAYEQGYYLLTVTGLATSAISTYYYLRFIKIFWFEKTTAQLPIACEITPFGKYAIVCAEAAIYFFVFILNYLNFELIFITVIPS